MAKRIIAAIAVSHGENGLDRAEQGSEVELSGQDEQRLDAEGALVPTEFDSFQAYSDHKIDAYRAGRGDTEAAQRLAEARRGGIVDLSQPGAGAEGGAQSHDEQVQAYATWLNESNPNIDAVVAQVEDDPAKARAMIEAEHAATGGQPRQGAVARLEQIASREQG